MDLTVGQIVWARSNKNDIYWPGKITIISNNTNDLWSTELQYNYLVQFFITNQSVWVNDILPYRQYKDSMTNDSFMNYGLNPAIKQDFLNAIHQADYANNDLNSMTIMTSQQEKFLPTIEDNTDNDFLLTPAPIFTSNTEYYNIPYQQSSNVTMQSLDNSNKTTQEFPTNNDWYSQQGLIVESITPPLPSEKDNQLQHISSFENCQKINSIIIITTKTYANSSFISYIFNCFSNFLHHSIIYIDDLTIMNYQHPNTSNIYYLICLDYFDSTIKQTLNSTILNNLNIHINYLFLVLNAPSHDLVKHFYSTIMDKRTILILHYHLTFENEPLLLCSGNRRTFEMIRLTILKYLCSKLKYIESEENEELYSSYCISSIIQSSNILNHFLDEQIHQTLHENFEKDFSDNNTNQSNEDILKNQSKQLTIINDLFENGIIKTHIPPPICEYYFENILHEK